MFRLPWFHPWADTLFQVCNDAFGDARINVFPFFIRCGFLIARVALRLVHLIFAFLWVMRFMHMNLCPPARSGVASARKADPGGVSPGLHGAPGLARATCRF